MGNSDSCSNRDESIRNTALYQLNVLIETIEECIDCNTALYRLNDLIGILEERNDYFQELDNWYREHSPNRSNEDSSVVEDEGYYNGVCMFKSVQLMNGVEVERKVREGTPSSNDSGDDGNESSSHRTHLSCSSFSTWVPSRSPDSSRSPFGGYYYPFIVSRECPSVD